MQRKLLTALGGIAAGALAATLALATPAPAAASAPALAGATAAQSQDDLPFVYRSAGPLARVLVRVTADLTGQDGTAVRQAVINGQSLAAFAAANGSSGDAVVQQVVARVSSWLDDAVAKGRLTRVRADRILERFTARANTLVNDTNLGERLAGSRG